MLSRLARNAENSRFNLRNMRIHFLPELRKESRMEAMHHLYMDIAPSGHFCPTFIS
jgi:hypothetical protein